MNFRTYLETQQCSTTTIDGYIRLSKRLLNWFENENIEPHKAGYNDMLAFIKHATGLGHSKRYVNEHLTVARHYFNYFIKIGKAKDNIASNLFIQGVSRRIPHDILEEEVLQSIYDNYPENGITGKRNKIMVGIMIYQGVSSYELAKLEPEHVNLKEGKIYISGSRRSNNRILPLMAQQVIGLDNYLKKVRPLILQVTENESEKLFLSMGGGKGFHNTMRRLTENIRKYFPELKSSTQIRASVITHWLSKLNLREVQYMAGHRYVSSTERYQLSNLDDLQNDLNEYHPL